MKDYINIQTQKLLKCMYGDTVRASSSSYLELSISTIIKLNQIEISGSHLDIISQLQMQSLMDFMTFPVFCLLCTKFTTHKKCLPQIKLNHTNVYHGLWTECFKRRTTEKISRFSDLSICLQKFIKVFI